MSKRTDRQQRREAEIRELIAQRGLHIEYGSRPHKFVRVYGPGVDVKAPRLDYLEPRDLEPFVPRESDAPDRRAWSNYV